MTASQETLLGCREGDMAVPLHRHGWSHPALVTLTLVIALSLLHLKPLRNIRKGGCTYGWLFYHPAPFSLSYLLSTDSSLFKRPMNSKRYSSQSFTGNAKGFISSVPTLREE